MKKNFIILLTVLSLCALFACTKKQGVGSNAIRVTLKDAVRSGDPARSFDNVSVEVVYQIYESLFQYDFFSENLDLIPNLAESMPKVSSDGKTYTIKIKKGVRFQDDKCFKATGSKGREVVAEDFIYAWNRHADPRVKSQGTWIFEDKVVDYKKENLQTEGFKALDPHTIQIKLKRPYPQLLHILALHFTAPLPKEVVDCYGKDFNMHPIGTGPFKAKHWNPTSRIVLEKNQNYRDVKHPKTEKALPLSDTIEFTVLKEEQPRWLGFLKGTFDQIEIPKDNFKTAVKNHDEVTDELKKKGIRISIEPSFNFWNIFINMKDPVLGKNKYLRQAIASAIDTQGWLNLFLNGRGIPQSEVNPPSITGRCGKPYRWSFDIERAKELLVKAGHPNGKGLPRFRYDTRTADNSERQLAEFIRKNLGKIGIQIDVVVNTFPAYLEKNRQGNLQLTKGSWFMDYPDAENTYQLLYGPNKAPGPNVSNFDHPEYNRLYEKMAVLRDSPRRKQIICKMEAIIQEEVPWAYGINENKYRLIQPWMENYRTAEFVLNKYKYIEIKRTN